MLAFATLLVEIEDINYDMPDDVILINKINMAKSNQDNPDILHRIRHAHIQGIEAVTNVNQECKYEQMQSVLKKHISSLEDNVN